MEKTKNNMDDKTLGMVALRTDQWCHIFFVQAQRFVKVFMDGTDGTFPWEENDKSSMHMGEKMFFITALHHAVEGLKCLKKELEKRNEDITLLNTVINMIATEDVIKDIKDLRNMNEHDIDYMIGNGNAQERFVRTVEKNGYKYKTNAQWTILIGDAQSFTIGNIQINDLIQRFKSQISTIDQLCKTIFEKYYFGIGGN